MKISSHNNNADSVLTNDKLPVRVDRKVGAQIVTRLHFPISPRTLERWPLNWRRINGRALIETAELLAEAQRRVAAAPVIKGGGQ